MKFVEKSKCCNGLFCCIGEGLIYSKIIFDKNKKAVDFIFIDINEAFEDIIGEKREKVLSKPASYFIENLDKNMINKLLEGSLNRKIESFEYYSERLERYYRVIIFNKTNEQFCALFINITDSISRLKYEIKYKVLMDVSIDTILIINEVGTIIEANKAAEKLYGYKNVELIGMNVYNMRALNERKNFKVQFNKAKTDGIVFETTHIKKDGTEFIVEVSSKSAMYEGQELVMSIIRDISQRKKMESDLEYTATHDFLTQIPNRISLLNKFSYMLEDAGKYNKKLAILYFDVDKFKLINDTYGHDAGDKVLVEVAKRVNSLIKKTDAIGRVGGDEFVVIQSSVKNINDIITLTQKILTEISRPIYLMDKSIVVNSSIGIAIFPDDTTDKELLINFSDKAMYEAKKIIGNSYKMYSEIEK